MENRDRIYVARFINHPLGGVRYTKDFKHNLSDDWNNGVWWKKADEEARQKHWDWALNHEQYHFSTDDINKADIWFHIDNDDEDKAILAKYAPVEFLESEGLE